MGQARKLDLSGDRGSQQTSRPADAQPGPARKLRIAVLSPYFFPDVGGTERAIEILTREFVALGHEVRIVTSARHPRPEEADRASGDIPASVEVVRRATLGDVLKAMRWADVGLINHVSLKLALPAVLTGKPCVIAHHMYMDRDGAPIRLPLRLLRLFVMSRARNIACSKAMRSTLNTAARVVHNGYRDDIWVAPPADAERPIDILYAGRMSVSKGVRTLLEAVAQLKDRGLRPAVVLVGPEAAGFSVAESVAALKIEDLVEYRGPKSAADMYAAQCAAKILAVPSEQELFGIVALEGIASGCVIAASNVGGLPEAVGPGGLLIPPGDAASWAAGLEHLLTHPSSVEQFRARAAEHLQQFSARRMAEGYLSVLLEAVSNGADFKPASAANSATAADTVSQVTPKILS